MAVNLYGTGKNMRKDTLQGRQELLEILQHCLAELNTIESLYQVEVEIDPFAVVEVIKDETPQPTLLAKEIKALTTIIELLTKLPNNFATLRGAISTTKFIVAAKGEVDSVAAGIPTDIQKEAFQTQINENEKTAPYLMAALVAQLNSLQIIIQTITALQSETTKPGKRNLVGINIPVIGLVGENALSGIPFVFMKIREIIRELHPLAQLTAQNENKIKEINNLKMAIAVNLTPGHFIVVPGHYLIKHFRQDELLPKFERTFEIVAQVAAIKPFYEYVETNMAELKQFDPLKAIFRTLASSYAHFNDHIPLLSEDEMQRLFGSNADIQENLLELKRLITRRIPQLCRRADYLCQLYTKIQTHIHTAFPNDEDAIVAAIVNHNLLQLESAALLSDDDAQLEQFTVRITKILGNTSVTVDDAITAITTFTTDEVQIVDMDDVEVIPVEMESALIQPISLRQDVLQQQLEENQLALAAIPDAITEYDHVLDRSYTIINTVKSYITALNVAIKSCTKLLTLAQQNITDRHTLSELLKSLTKIKLPENLDTISKYCEHNEHATFETFLKGLQHPAHDQDGDIIAQLNWKFAFKKETKNKFTSAPARATQAILAFSQNLNSIKKALDDMVNLQRENSQTNTSQIRKKVNAIAALEAHIMAQQRELDQLAILKEALPHSDDYLLVAEDTLGLDTIPVDISKQYLSVEGFEVTAQTTTLDLCHDYNQAQLDKAFNELKDVLLQDDFDQETLEAKIKTLFNKTLNTQQDLLQSIIAPNYITTLVETLVAQDSQNNFTKIEWLIKQAAKLSIALAFDNHTLPETWAHTINDYHIFNPKAATPAADQPANAAVVTPNQQKLNQHVFPYLAKLVEAVDKNQSINPKQSPIKAILSIIWNAISNAISGLIHFIKHESAPEPTPKELKAYLNQRLFKPCRLEARLDENPTEMAAP